MAYDSHVLLWSTAISTNHENGRRIIYRYADLIDPVFDRASQPVRVIIVWKYQSDTGQPLSEELQRMYEMEEALESVFDQHGMVTLTLVSTGENLREWIYYSQSEDQFMTSLNLALSGSARFPIEIHIEQDPEWGLYDRFRSSVKEGRVN